MNYYKLKGLLREKGKTYHDCAAGIGIDYSTFCGKINGTRDWKLGEINALWRYLGMRPSTVVFYFFASEVDETGE